MLSIPDLAFELQIVDRLLNTFVAFGDGLDSDFLVADFVLNLFDQCLERFGFFGKLSDADEFLDELALFICGL
ncbi:hypothetical protein D3C71_1125230 [compost metagenome]